MKILKHPIIKMFSRMSIYVFVFLMANPLFANNTYGQSLDNTKVSISLNNATAVEAFKIIENQTPFSFIYDNKILRNTERISFNDKNISVRKILEKISKEARLKFKQVNRSISVNVIPKKEVVVVIPIFKEITGKVTDKNGQPLPGANILVKGTSIGTTTGFEGDFALQIPDNAEILVVSYIGFKTKEVPIGGKTNFTIQLEEDAQTLSEVVVTGFRKSLEESIGIKKNTINAVDAVVAEDIAKFPQSNMAEALQRVSGVQIRRDDAGGVGNGVSIRGLPQEYTQVTINGDAVPNSTGGRSYDFNTLPAEIFKQLEVSKTPTASSTEGGIGGSVNLVTKKPFEIKEKIMIASVEGNYNTQQQQGNSVAPKLSLTYGNKWNDKFGIIAGVFYNKFFNNSEGYDVTRYYDESYDLDGDGVNEFENIQVPRPRYVSQGQKVERLSINLSLQYQVNKDFDLVFEGLFVNNDQEETRYTPIWFLPGDNPTNIIADGPFVRSITYQSVLSKLENQRQNNITKNYRWSVKGKYNLNKGWKASAKFIHAFNKRDSERFRYYADNVNAVTYDIQNDIEFFDLQTPTNFSNADEFVMSQARRYLWDFSDEILTSKIDISKKFNKTFNIKFGTINRLVN